MQVVVDPTTWPLYKTAHLSQSTGILHPWSNVTTTRVGAVWPDVFVSRLHAVINSCDHELMARMRADCRRLLIPIPLTSSTSSSTCTFSVDCWMLYWFKNYNSLYQFTAGLLFVYGVSMNGVCTRTVVVEFLISLVAVDENLEGYMFNQLELFTVLYNVIYFILDYMSELKDEVGCNVYITRMEVPSLESVFRHIRNSLTSKVEHMQGMDPTSNSVYNQKINELRERCRLERLRSSARIRGLKDALFRETAQYDNWIQEESQRYKEYQQLLLLEQRFVHE